jgi:transcription elongation GreA/GreB family factor
MEGATHEEARPENDKDTRGLEQSYLARGQAQRVAELETAVSVTMQLSTSRLSSEAAVVVGALVTVDDEDHQRRFFVAAHGGGHVLPGKILVVTPNAPIGRALFGQRVDDECEVVLGGAKRTLTITSIE